MIRWNLFFEVEKVEQLALIDRLATHHDRPPSLKASGKRNHDSSISTRPFSTGSVRVGHSTVSAQCPNCPPKRKSIRALAMSQKCQEPTSPPCSADLLEHFHGCERFSRPRPETVQCELCLLSGLDINKQVVVLLLRRPALPIEVSRIIRRHLDSRATWENRVLFCATAAQQQVLHAVHLV